MSNQKVVPFPAVAPTAVSPQTARANRVVVRLGRQRIALDIACRATLLSDPPALHDSRLGKRDETPTP